MAHLSTGPSTTAHLDPNLTGAVIEWGDGTNDLLLVDTEGDCSEGWRWNASSETRRSGRGCAAVIEADHRVGVSVVVDCTEGELIPEIG